MIKATSIVLAVLTLVATISAQPPEQKPRALQANIFWASIYPRVFRPITVDTLETPIQIRAFLYFNFAMWSAWANYHPTAADIFGRTRFKRPAAEHNLENQNVAMMFALYRIYEADPPSFGDESGFAPFRAFIREQGHDPDDRSMDMSTPVGIGNREGADIARLMAVDGWNSKGDRTARSANYRQPFRDYTGYAPKNSPWELTYPFRYQPVLENNGRGFFFRHEFVVPQIGSAISFSLTPDEVRNRTVAGPYIKSDAVRGRENRFDRRRLRRQALRVVKRSRQLTEYQRVLAEYFDNKVTSFMTPVQPRGTFGIACMFRLTVLPNALNWGVDEDMVYGLGANIATIDSTILAWKEKRRIDAVRPSGQTMEMVFGNRPLTVWGGVGRGPTSISPAEWQPYLRTMPHAEFPSGSSCLCWTLVEHALISTGGRNDFPYKFTIPRGSSKFYPGQIPSTDVEVEINKLTDWGQLCADSRLWAGVHFTPAVHAGKELCQGLGQKAQNVVDRLLSGQVDDTFMKWLPSDTNRFWEED